MQPYFFFLSCFKKNNYLQLEEDIVCDTLHRVNHITHIMITLCVLVIRYFRKPKKRKNKFSKPDKETDDSGNDGINLSCYSCKTRTIKYISR